MPPPSSRMTAQPKPQQRYFARPYEVNETASDDSSSEEDEEPQPQREKNAPPTITSFPKSAPKAPEAKEDIGLDGFVTDSGSSDENEEDGSSSGEEGDSSEEESDDEPKRPMLAPKFVSSKARISQQTAAPATDPVEAERKRKEKADELLQAQIERDAAARKAGKKYWDDDDVQTNDVVDDTDGLDPEAEHAAWKLRELKRVRRDRQALIVREKEREEIERRKNLSTQEQEAEDRAFLEKQAEEKDGKGKMQYMQKYFHKGAFFNDDEQDEEVKAALNRDFAGHKFEDEAGNKAVLPEYMRIRDSTKLGKKGRSKYKDLKSEDTGAWGRLENKKRDYDGLDERFRPDERGGPESTGANSAPVGERRRRDEEAGGDQKRVRRD